MHGRAREDVSVGIVAGGKRSQMINERLDKW